jgi:hypothetical protein
MVLTLWVRRLVTHDSDVDESGGYVDELLQIGDRHS